MKGNLEVKEVSIYLVTSINQNDNDRVSREVVKSMYKIDSLPNFINFEKDFRNYKKNESLLILATSLLNVEHEVYYNGKPLVIKEDGE